MEFIDYWKGAIKGYFQHSPEKVKQGVYTSLCLATGIPLIAAFLDPGIYGTTIPALVAMLSNIGGNLVATLLEQWSNEDGIDKEGMLDLLQQNVEQDEQLRTQYDEIIRQLQVVEAAQRSLSDEDKAWFHKTLQEELPVHSPIRNIYMQGGAYFEYLVVEGDFNIYNLHISPDYSSLIETYYRVLSKRCQQLPLGILDEEFLDVNNGSDIELQEVYTDLDVVSIPKKEDEDEKQYGWRLSRAESGERTPLMDAISQEKLSYLVLLGDAGSGKTTFVNYLTYLILEDQEKLPDILKNIPVIRLHLRNATKYLPKNRTSGFANMLWNTIRDEFIEISTKETGEKAFEQWMKAICEQPSVVLLDGLDEVPESNERRKCLLSAIQDFLSCLKMGSRVLITARPYAYAQKDWNLLHFHSLAIASFNRKQIINFVSAWYKAVQGKGNDWEDKFILERKKELLGAIFDSDRTYLGDLATKPVLLTLMAMQHASNGELPEDRAVLYEKAVGLLLKRWQRQRISGKRPEEDDTLDESIRNALRLGEDNLRMGLEKVALLVHEKQQNIMQGNSQTWEVLDSAEITKSELLEVFSNLFRSVNPADLIEFIEKRSGLLIAREDGVFVFAHRSFQEFLSACQILNDDPNSILERLDEDLDWWREVYLFAVGRLKKTLFYSISLIQELCQKPISEAGNIATIKEHEWRKVSLAGEAILELRLMDMPENYKKYDYLVRRIRDWLTELVQKGKLEAKERLLSGDVLGKIGDFRKGVNVKVNDDLLYPDIDWVRIPEGKFMMGSTDEVKDAYPDEKQQHSLYLPEFWISRYPITNVQYEPFIKVGYQNSKWWSTEGWDWCNGKNSELTEIKDKDYREIYESHLKVLTKEKRNQPYWHDEKPWNGNNRPVVGVTWFEVYAYTQWLTEITNDYELYRECGLERVYISIPSEAEWEKADRGMDGKIFPWGNKWKNDAANIRNTQLSTTSVAGMFPKGRSEPYGLLDSAGNVWEWTRTIWGADQRKPEFNYEYQINDGRENINSWAFRVLRGGSWLFNEWDTRCALRFRLHPDFYSNDVGFRIILFRSSSDAKS